MNVNLNKSDLLLLCDKAYETLNGEHCRTLCAAFGSAIRKCIIELSTHPSPSRSAYEILQEQIMPWMLYHKPELPSQYMLWWPLSDQAIRFETLAKIKQDIENSDIE